MISTNFISKVFNAGRLFTLHNYFYIPLAGVKTKDAIELPEKPKKPMTSFFRFVQEHKPVLLKEQPQLKLTEIVKQCAQDWKNIHPTIKERYDNEYKAEMESYAKKHLDYSMKLTDEQKEYLKLLNREKTQSTKKRRLRKKLKDMKKPKKPPGPFLLYLIEQSNIQGRKINEMMKELKGTWHLLDESVKMSYVKKNEELMIKYKEDLENWETLMIQEGHPDLVRSKFLKDERPFTARKKSVSEKDKSESQTSDEKNIRNK
ncbi:transcription factor A, mitochondrial [Coccinella septempunctata]|uniref:transcription factor A, mitochondrial n=1 Tax=Coccinella septempunctata TaxID=41139 RepID=UPI001D0809E7|nr:transcription factor A, mitochondrial [Coccinella septempunctata]